MVHQGGESLAAALERLTTNVLRASTQLANRSAAVEVRGRRVKSGAHWYVHGMCSCMWTRCMAGALMPRGVASTCQSACQRFGMGLDGAGVGWGGMGWNKRASDGALGPGWRGRGQRRDKIGKLRLMYRPAPNHL